MLWGVHTRSWAVVERMLDHATVSLFFAILLFFFWCLCLFWVFPVVSHPTLPSLSSTTDKWCPTSLKRKKPTKPSSRN